MYNELDCFSWLAKKKEEGLVKHMGFSFHDNAQVLDKVLTEHPELEFVQLQINYLDWEAKEFSLEDVMKWQPNTISQSSLWNL